MPQLVRPSERYRESYIAAVRKIIEANGVVLEDEIEVEREPVSKRRYWIELE